MPASRSGETSAVRTGISQLAVSLVAFGTLGGAAVGAVQVFGDDEAGGPRVEIALFAPESGEPPILKTSRLENAIDDPTAASGEPTLPGVEYMEGGHEGEDGESGYKITEVDGKGDAAAQPFVASPLPKAPMLGFFERTPAGDLPRISPEGHTPAEAYARPFTPSGAPRVALIVGGLGLKDKITAAAINELPPEVTLSFVPYAKDLQTWINRARAAGHEVMLELPMEPYDYPNNDTGPQTLLTGASQDENARRLNLLLGRASGYFGVMNYQGAKFATDARAAGPVFAALGARGMVFVHDGAATRSVLPDAASKAKLGFSTADRIVDSDLSADAIDRNLLQLEALAIQNGKALGVGSAYPVTIEQFRLWTQSLKSKGYQLAPASAASGVATPGKSG